MLEFLRAIVLIYLSSRCSETFVHLFPHDLGEQPSFFFSLCNCIAKHCTAHAASPTALPKTVGMTCSDLQDCTSWFLSESFSFHFTLSLSGIIHMISYVCSNKQLLNVKQPIIIYVVPNFQL